MLCIIISAAFLDHKAFPRDATTTILLGMAAAALSTFADDMAADEGATVLFVLDGGLPSSLPLTAATAVLDVLMKKYNAKSVWLLPHHHHDIEMIQKHMVCGTCVFIGNSPAEILKDTLPGVDINNVPRLVGDISLSHQEEGNKKYATTTAAAFELLRSILPGFTDEQDFSEIFKLTTTTTTTTTAAVHTATVPSSSLVPGQLINVDLVNQAIELGVDTATMAHQAAMSETAFCAALKRSINKDMFDKLMSGRNGRRLQRVDRSADVDREFLEQCRTMGFSCADLAIMNAAPVACADVGRVLGIKNATRDSRQPKASDPTRDNWLSTEDLLFLLNRVSSLRLAEVLRRHRRSRILSVDDWVSFLERVRSGMAVASENPQRRDAGGPATAARRRRGDGGAPKLSAEEKDGEPSAAASSAATTLLLPVENNKKSKRTRVKKNSGAEMSEEKKPKRMQQQRRATKKPQQEGGATTAVEIETTIAAEQEEEEAIVENKPKRGPRRSAAAQSKMEKDAAVADMSGGAATASSSSTILPYPPTKRTRKGGEAGVLKKQKKTDDDQHQVENDDVDVAAAAEQPKKKRAAPKKTATSSLPPLLLLPTIEDVEEVAAAAALLPFDE